MFAIKINNRLVRDDRGCVYKYSNRKVAEMKAEMIVRKMWRVGYKADDRGKG